jgi:hypothetical protein
MTLSKTFRILALWCAVGGCAVQAPLHRDHKAMTCEQLLSESKRLLAKQSDRSEYLLEDVEAERRATAAQLRAVKQSITEKNC